MNQKIIIKINTQLMILNIFIDMESIILVDYQIYILKVDINSNSNMIENIFIFNKFYSTYQDVLFRKEYNYKAIIFHLKNESVKSKDIISLSLSPISSLKNYNKNEEKKFIL